MGLKDELFNLGGEIEGGQGAPVLEPSLQPQGDFDGLLSVAVTFTEAHYQQNQGALPGPDDFAFLRGKLGDSGIDLMLSSPQFRNAMTKRGIHWPKKWQRAPAKALSKLTPQQHQCVMVVTDPTRSEGLKKRLELVGVTYNQYRNWMREPAFANAVTVLSEDVLNDNLASIHTSVASRAAAGDVTAAKLVYELTGRHDPNKQQMLDLTRIIALLLESLTRHVTDTAILNKVNQDFGIILSGDMPAIEASSPDFSFAQQIVDAEIVPEEVVSDHDESSSDAVGTQRDTGNVPKGFFDI